MAGARDRKETATDLADMVADSAQLQEEVRRDPAGTLQRLAAPLESDFWIYRMVVTVLGLTMLSVVAASTLIVLKDKPIPDILVAVGTGAVGALAGLLAPSPSRSN
ncbi:MAG: hypothetical protein ACRDN6_02120 [Gaiellaceae bacterium]